jgi:hypothetical protein
MTLDDCTGLPVQFGTYYPVLPQAHLRPFNRAQLASNSAGLPGQLTVSTRVP